MDEQRPTAITFDEEASRQVEAAYQTTDVVAQRAGVLAAVAPAAGERILDIGSGPGLLSAALAAVVGSEGQVCGVDASESMVEMGRRRCAELSQVRFDCADACALPYEDSSFDVAISTQVYEYVPDVAAALAEAFRVLRPGARMAVLDTDYDSLVIHTEDPERMRRVLAAWDEHFVHRDLPRSLRGLLEGAGFALRRSAAIPMFNLEYRADRFSRHLVTIMASFAAGRRGVTAEEARAWLEELEQLARIGRYFFSLNRYLFVAERPP